ncbi:MAG: alpha/beta hydrolase family protein [Gemmatimonadaceae bacterium]
MKVQAVLLSLIVAAAGVARAQSIELPEPWGVNAVGHARIDLTDSTRRETRGEAAGGHRRVVVQIWYPGRGPVRRAMPYMDSATAAVWGSSHRLPAGFERRVLTHAQRDLPMIDSLGALPVLLFSHGRSWPVQTYQAMLQDLASRGWLVVAMSHPYDEAATTFADGSVARFDPERWENETERGVVLNRSVDVLVRDAAFVLETLGRWNAQRQHRFFGRIDLDKIGYFGHSLGGAAAVQALHRLPALRAAATIEGSVYDTTARPFRVTKPVLSIIGGYNRAELGLRDYLAAPGGVLYEAIVHGAWHASFADLLLVYGAFAPRAWHASHRRELAPARVNQITTDYLDAFFARYLRGETSQLLRPHSDPELGSYTTSGYPEVELRIVAG